jgi:copper chaperone CopZ
MRTRQNEIMCAFLILAALCTQVQGAKPTRRSPAIGAKTTIVVEEMHCKGCARKIAAKLYTVPGVKSVGVSMKSRTLSVTSQQGHALSYLLLAEAVEKANDHALRIVGPMGAYQRTYVDSSSAESKVSSVTSVTVEDLNSPADEQKITAALHALSGVHKVEFDRSTNKLTLTTQPEATLSPWRIWEAVEQGGSHAILIRGPQGSLSRLQTQAIATDRLSR